MVIYRLHCFF